MYTLPAVSLPHPTHTTQCVYVCVCAKPHPPISPIPRAMCIAPSRQLASRSRSPHSRTVAARFNVFCSGNTQPNTQHGSSQSAGAGGLLGLRWGRVGARAPWGLSVKGLGGGAGWWWVGLWLGLRRVGCHVE